MNSYYQTADLDVFFQSLISFRTFLTKFSKETLFHTFISRFYFSVFFRRRRYQTKPTLAVTLLFQYNFSY